MDSPPEGGMLKGELFPCLARRGADVRTRALLPRSSSCALRRELRRRSAERGSGISLSTQGRRSGPNAAQVFTTISRPHWGT